MAVDTMGICQFLVRGPSGGVIRGSHFSAGGILFPVYKQRARCQASDRLPVHSPNLCPTPRIGAHTLISKLENSLEN